MVRCYMCNKDKCGCYINPKFGYVEGVLNGLEKLSILGILMGILMIVSIM